MMNASPGGFQWSRAESPLPAKLSQELIPYWENIFEVSFAGLRPVLAGEERDRNRDTIYMAHKDGNLAGTSHLTVSESKLKLGGLGEVATSQDCRNQGIASQLSAQARNDFLERSGRALFLGTVNPMAERLYHQLGWRKLDRTHVMCLDATGQPPEAFLADYFRDVSRPQALPGDAGDRISVIPLIIANHDWHILDANINLFSTRAAVQCSCMGLYPRYARLRQEDEGEWFVTRGDEGQLVGLSTARRGPSGCIQVDGFTHSNFQNAWGELIGRSVEWAQAQNADRTTARIAVADKQKQQLFKSLGFAQVAAGEPFLTGSQRMDCVCLEKR